MDNFQISQYSYSINKERKPNFSPSNFRFIQFIKKQIFNRIEVANEKPYFSFKLQLLDKQYNYFSLYMTASLYHLYQDLSSSPRDAKIFERGCKINMNSPFQIKSLFHI